MRTCRSWYTGWIEVPAGFIPIAGSSPAVRTNYADRGETKRSLLLGAIREEGA